MIRHGEPPYLECSSRGDVRFSAFRAVIASRGFTSIEQLYQSAKKFPPGPGVDIFGHMANWREAKGKHGLNQDEVAALYETLWREYLVENRFLVRVLTAATGLSDMFGQPGHVCQASVLWKLRAEYLNGSSLSE
jgi:hypothetical protein